MTIGICISFDFFAIGLTLDRTHNTVVIWFLPCIGLWFQISD